MTVKTSLWALQKAVYSKLDTNTELKKAIAEIFDEVPTDAVLPYVMLGDDTVNPYDTKTDNGEDCTLTLHCYSEGPGKTQTKQIMDLVLQALTDSPLTLDNFEFEGIKREFLNVMQEGNYYHGICRFRVYVKQI
jgi:hypothetical protein